MSAVRKPTAIHELNNTGKVHPERMRERDSEPVPPGGIGKCPDDLSDQHRQIWDDYVGASAQGVLTSSDRRAFRLLVELTYMMEVSFQTMSVGHIGQLRLLLGQFGFTPSDRSKVSVPKGKTKNPYDDL